MKVTVHAYHPILYQLEHVKQKSKSIFRIVKNSPFSEEREYQVAQTFYSEIYNEGLKFLKEKSTRANWGESGITISEMRKNSRGTPKYYSKTFCPDLDGKNKTWAALSKWENRLSSYTLAKF